MRVRRLDETLIYEWDVDGERRPADESALAWLDDALEVVAAIREGDRLRDEGEDYAAQLDRVLTEERALRARIGELLESRSRLEREIGSIRAEERDLRGRIADLLGEETALRAEAGEHRVRLASLAAQLEDAEGARREEIEAERARRTAALEAVLERLRSDGHGARIRRLEKELAGLDTAGRVGRIEDRIAALNVDARAEELGDELRGMRVPERTAALQNRLEHVRERLADLRRRVETRMARLASADGGR